MSNGALHLNDRAWEIADRMAAHADALRVAVRTLPSGARVIDAGIDVPGGYGAGLALAEICMGGMGDVDYTPVQIGGDSWPGVRVWTDHPAVSCMASQYAGWAIQVDRYFAMGSGPLRAHARVERELFEKLGYAETAERGVLVLETRNDPPDAVAAWVGRKAGLAPPQLTFVAAPTASLAGGVQIAARILYGGQARYTVNAEDALLADLVPKIPASASRDYGTPFSEIFKRYGGDFYKIDPLLFSPAEVWLTNVQSGKTYHAGRLNPEVLRASLVES